MSCLKCSLWARNRERGRTTGRAAAGTTTRKTGRNCRGTDRDDGQSAAQHGHRAETYARTLLHHLLDGLHVADHLRLEDARADPRVAADGQLLHAGAQRGADARRHPPHAPVQQPDAEKVQGVVDDEDERDDADAAPQPGDLQVLHHRVHDGGGHQRQERWRLRQKG